MKRYNRLPTARSAYYLVLDLPWNNLAITAALRSEHNQASRPPTRTVSEWADQERVLSLRLPRKRAVAHLSRPLHARGHGRGHRFRRRDHRQPEGGADFETECINNIVGYFIAEDPSTILVIQPTLELAEAWSRDRLAPMLRDTPALRGKVQDPRSCDSGNTVKHKEFPGGRLTVVGANSPTGLRARSIRVVLADEVDSYPPSVGTEGIR